MLIYQRVIWYHRKHIKPDLFSFSGTLNFGADADFIMIDIKDNEGKMDILSTWIFGEKVYDSKS